MNPYRFDLSAYNSGSLSEAVLALQMPAMCVEAQANAVLRCARKAMPGEISRRAVGDAIERLEKATATLREALDVAKPALSLVAAE